MVDGEKVEVSVDGKKMIKTRDSEISKGQIALITEKRLPLTVIDDFVVRQIQKKNLFTEKQNRKESLPITQTLISVNSSSDFKQSTVTEDSYIYRERGKGPNAGNGYENYILESGTLNLESETLNPEPSPDYIYQTTSALPPIETVYYYHHDHLGNIRVVTDKDKNVVERHDFYPFGEEITTQPQTSDQYLFTDKLRDSETGLDYFGARYYSSNLSRWLSPDTITNIKRNIENPQRWNLYHYCRNNPLVFIDPAGAVEVKFHIKFTSLSSSELYNKYGSYGGASDIKLGVHVEPTRTGILWSPNVTFELKFEIISPKPNDDVYEWGKKGAFNMPKSPQESISHELGHVLVSTLQQLPLLEQAVKLENWKTDYFSCKAAGTLFEIGSYVFNASASIILQNLLYETLSGLGLKLVRSESITSEIPEELEFTIIIK